jgi:hypothetical protein
MIRQIALLLIVTLWIGPASASGPDDEFRTIRLGSTFEPTNLGYKSGGKIAAGPGVQMDYYTKLHRGGRIVHAVSIYRGVVVIKSQSGFQPNKSDCQQNTVRMVEVFQKAGVAGWQIDWRKDYDVPVYRVNHRGVNAKIMCRMKNGGWWLDYIQRIQGQQFLKLFR